MRDSSARRWRRIPQVSSWCRPAVTNALDRYKNMIPTRLLVADDHPLIRVGLRHLLEEQSNWKVVAEAQDGREAVTKARETRPDIAILDIGMPELNGFDAAAQIASEIPSTKVLILSMHQTDTIFKKVLAAGARGYLLKSDAPRDLVAAVQAIRGNKTFFTSKVSRLIVDGFLNDRRIAAADEAVCITPRQREVVQLIAEGKSNREIGFILNITEKTAETHRANIMRRLNLHSVSEIVRYAVRNEVIQA
jgi:DNA-binding NarL/FixJ family response regulator